MKFASERLDLIAPSASEQASAKAREMKAAGIDVISLATGEPDFDTPAHIIEAAATAMKNGDTRYTNAGGTAALKQAIQNKFLRDNQLEYALDEIIVTAGAKNMIFSALTATLNPGDEVIVPAPYWVSYTDMTLLAGGKPVVVPCEAEHDYKLTPALLENAITPKTRWLLINSPSNPTGAIYSREELLALAEVLERHPHVLTMTDEIYEHILFDGLKFHSLAAVAPQLKSRILTVNGVSKAYSMTGWRIGFAGGPAPLIAVMRKVQSQTIGSISSIMQAGAVAALEGTQSYLPGRAAKFQERRDLVMQKLEGVPGLRCYRADGAFYQYISCAGLLGKTTPAGKRLENDMDVTAYILDEAKVMTVAGAAYGLSPYFRISTATSNEILGQACERIAAAIAKLV